MGDVIHTSLSAGLVKLTPKQASKLSAPTARSQHDPTSYVGILEVMHQLHCLVSRGSYQTNLVLVSIMLTTNSALPEKSSLHF